MHVDKLSPSVYWYFNWQAKIACQLQSANAVSESAYDEFLTWCFELEEHHQKALQENTELAEEVEQLKMQLKKRTAETEKLSKTVNDMDQVSFITQSSHSCQLFLPSLLSDIMVYDSTHLLYSRDTSLNSNMEIGCPDCSFIWFS